MTAEKKYLAKLLREQLEVGKSNMSVGSGSQWARGDELVTRTILLARDFAEYLDAAEAEQFLTACGV